MVTRVAKVFKLWGGTQARGTCGHLCRGPGMCLHRIEVRLCANVSTCDLDLQLCKGEDFAQVLPGFQLCTVLLPRGENIPSQLPAPHPVSRPFSKVKCVCRGLGLWTWELDGYTSCPFPLSEP